MINNGLTSILKKNGFRQINNVVWVNGKFELRDFKDEYTLTYDVDEYGFLHQILIVWIKYERCVEELSKAIILTEMQYETNTNL